MIAVELTAYELALAAGVGARRHIAALVQRLPDRHGFDGANGWQVHVEGACGELALAKAINRYWNGSVNTFKQGGDVGALQVRTRSKHAYDLIVRADDSDLDRFVLVTGAAPSFKVWGFCSGAEAKQDRFLQTYGDRPAAYFVPKAALHSIGPLQ